jgi:DNA-binding response OmpR family regulator
MHLLVVEDEHRLADRLRRALLEDRHTVEVTGDGRKALDLALAGTFDAIVLDLMIPGLDGLNVCRALRDAGSHTPVLMLTARGSVNDRVTGLTAGADDYLVKPFAMLELRARVSALLRRVGRPFESSPELLVGDLSLDLTRHIATRDGRTIELTAKEFALLELLMRHPGQVLSRTQITNHVWGYDLEALSNVVEIYIHYLRDKLDRGYAQSLIRTVRGVGYVIGE